MGTSWRLYSSTARSSDCFACRSSAAAFWTSGVCSIGGRTVRAGGTVFCQRAFEDGVLFVGAVPQFLVVELDEHLPGGHAIAEIGQDPIHPARRLGGNRDLVVGGQRAHDLDVASNGLCLDGLDLDRLDVSTARAGTFSPFEQPDDTTPRSTARPRQGYRIGEVTRIGQQPAEENPWIL